MRGLTFTIVAMLAFASPLGAMPSSHFSAVPGTEFAWQLSRSGGDWLLLFPVNSSQIDGSTPADASLLDDYVNLPTMTLEDLEDHGSYFTARLSPTDSLAIVSNTGEGTVLKATLASRGGFFIGTNFIAYSNPADDLDITGHVAGYSLVIAEMVAAEAAGSEIDLSLSGDAAGGLNLLDALRDSDETSLLTGSSLSGQITVVPIPSALLVAAAGSLAAAYLYRRVPS